MLVPPQKINMKVDWEYIKNLQHEINYNTLISFMNWD